jgi:tetratricopeptide (TPR) repeat protein
MTVLFAVALTLRVVHILAMRQSPYFNHPVIDAFTYHQAALSIASGHGHPDRVFWQPPGYSYFLAMLYAFAGSANLLVPRIVQALLGSAAAVLTAWIGARHLGSRAGLAAGYVVAAYGMLIYFDGELLAASLTVFLQLAAVALAVRAQDAENPRRSWLVAGIVAGLASLVTATSLVLAAVMAVAARRNAPAVILGAALAIAPATLRNWAHGGEFVPISSNAGINLYIGNNPEYDRTVAIRPDHVWQQFTKEPFDHGVRTQSGASMYWTGRVLQWAAQDPAAFAALQLKKVRLLLGGDEIYRNQAIYPSRRYSPVLRPLIWKIPGLAFPFGVLAPLALLGIAVAWRRAPLLAAFVLLYAMAVLAFFIAARYRVPLVPYLAIFGVAGAIWIRHATTPRRLVGAAALLALFVLCNAGQGGMAADMNADAEFNLGEQLHSEGKLGEAEEHYRNAIRGSPGLLEAWVNLGVLQSTQGRYDEGSRSLEEAVRIAPGNATALMSLGALRERQQRWSDAAVLYERAAAADPSDPDPRRRVERLREQGLLGASGAK